MLRAGAAGRGAPLVSSVFPTHLLVVGSAEGHHGLENLWVLDEKKVDLLEVGELGFGAGLEARLRTASNKRSECKTCWYV